MLHISYFSSDFTFFRTKFKHFYLFSETVPRVHHYIMYVMILCELFLWTEITKSRILFKSVASLFTTLKISIFNKDYLSLHTF